jgi:predicted Zn-dependent protease
VTEIAALQRLAEMLLLAGEDTAAHELLQALAQTDPLNAAKGEVTRALLGGHAAQALLIARRAVERFPADLEVQLLAAHCLTALGRLREAAARLRMACAQHPESAAAWLQWAELQAQQGNSMAVHAVIAAGLAHRDDAAVLWLALARWHVKYGELRPAVEAYREAVMRDPRDRELWLESAAVLAEATTALAAAQWLDVALAGPLAADADAYVACAEAWTAAGDLAKAAAVLARAP